MNSELTRKFIGGTATLCGLWLICVYTLPQLGSAWTEGLNSDEILITLLFFLITSSPAILFLYFGVRLVRQMSEPSLKYILGGFSVSLTLFLYLKIQQISPQSFNKNLIDSILLFLSLFMAIIIYVSLARLLLRHLTKQTHTTASLVSTWALLLMVFLLWKIGFTVFQEYSPVDLGFNHISQKAWNILGTLIPCLIAYGFYRILNVQLKKEMNHIVDRA